MSKLCTLPRLATLTATFILNMNYCLTTYWTADAKASKKQMSHQISTRYADRMLL